MMRRVFWFVVGAGVGIYALKKARDYMHKATPEAVGSRVAESAAGIGDSIRDFTATVRAAMAERETELRDTLGLPHNQE